MPLLHQHDTLGDLVIEKALTNGGQAEIYLARANKWSVTFPPGHRYVLKAVADSNQGIFLDDETIHLTRLQTNELHPNIVRLVDWSTGKPLKGTAGQKIRHEVRANGIDSFRCILFDYLPGGALQKMLDEHLKLSVNDAVATGREILTALVYIHKQQMIHLDVKPDNVLFQPDGRRDRLRRLFGYRTESAVLIDFGIARRYTDTHPPGKGMGDPQYASPEQYSEATYTDNVPLDKSCGPTSDVFSWGVVMYKCLTGRNPHGDKFLDFNPILLERPEYNPEPPSKTNKAIPKELDKVILKCLQKNPRDRYRNAQEALDALNAATTHLRSISTRVLSRVVLLAALLVVLVVGCGAISLSAWLFAAQAGVVGTPVSVADTASPIPETPTQAAPTSASIMILPSQTSAPQATVSASATPALKATSTTRPTPTPTKTFTPVPPTITGLPLATSTPQPANQNPKPTDPPKPAQTQPAKSPPAPAP